MIYIIFGASGNGKTTLINIAGEKFGKRAINKKATTRSQRLYEDVEIISYEKGIPLGKYEYQYEKYGYQYAIDKRQIEAAAVGGYPHFVICSDIDTIRIIKKDFPEWVRIIYLEFKGSKNRIREIQQKRGISQDEITLRLKEVDYLKRTYLENKKLFDGIIINDEIAQNPYLKLRVQLEKLMKAIEYNNVYSND